MNRKLSREDLKAGKKIVIKVGSALLTGNGKGLDSRFVLSIVEQIVQLKQNGLDVVLVSSGAVAEGMVRLGWDARPSEVHELQTAAAVGQMGLIKAYEAKFNRYGINTAQILLTGEDLSDRQRYLNARSTLKTLLQNNVVPVVNENDTVITDEIRFGDNDTLAALVANLVEADLLIILTDQQGLFDSDPRSNKAAKLISDVDASDKDLEELCKGGSGKFGTGGMLTKVKAARKAARSGSATVVAKGDEKDILLQVCNGENVGTLFIPDCKPLDARKRWLAGNLQPKGELIIDSGAVDVLQKGGKSLLPVGVTEVIGCFNRGELVLCRDLDKNEIARGLVNYDYAAAVKIIGKSSVSIKDVLGYMNEPEIIHRDNLVITE
ncbi:MAG: glutamate 5-kinase [Gammaproteobacteria bacterium]|nr:MAG: glutamate 5-kinase [Gammaproteobacteria bacterium]